MIVYEYSHSASGYVYRIVVSYPDPSYSAALGVLHHQHAEGRVWKLLHGFRVQLECNQTRSHTLLKRRCIHTPKKVYTVRFKFYPPGV